VVDVLGRPMGSAAAHCLYLRERKTPEELALCRRAYGYSIASMRSRAI
jgi:hypothetical protein